eukprot:TRINITY_DN726_c0_g1_i1.p1 TRINITY_DN726_c0_g1~~TRINITY_DN726_c0_g1_i1.p1  ORF type:complete len:340 (-),score=107.87 TRINITY_DN726_c0_g1_i1:57-1076(-)
MALKAAISSSLRLFSKSSVGCVASRARFSAKVQVPIELLKQLRERTGSPMVECRDALAASELNIEKAIDILRKKGASVALKNSGRLAAQGLVAVASSADDKSAVLVELNSETDFVARNERFQAGLAQISQAALSAPSSAASANGASDIPLDTFKEVQVQGTKVGDIVTDLVGSIRENIQLRRAAKVSVAQGVVGSYVHQALCPGMGRVAALVALESSSPNKEALKALADQLAMHVAAQKPAYLSRQTVPQEIVQREQEVQWEAARKAFPGKPENILKNIVEGRFGKFYEEIALLEQNYALGEKPEKISKIVAAEAKKLSTDIKLSGYAVFECGKGHPSS